MDSAILSRIKLSSVVPRKASYQVMVEQLGSGRISDILSVGLVRYLLMATIPLSAVIFVIIISLPLKEVPSTAQNVGTSIGIGTAARLTALSGASITATPTSDASEQPSTKPAEGQFSSPKTVNSELPLSGRRIGLDPGHGPLDDMGAVLVNPSTGKLILSEAEFNLDVALRCRDILLARGASVVLTRETADTFTTTWPSDANGDGIVGGSGDDLQERVDILNAFHAEVFLSIHANGGNSDPPAMDDLEVLYCGTADCAFPAESKRLGQIILDQLQAKLATVDSVGPGGAVLTDLSIDPSNPPQHLFVLGPVNPPRHVRAATMPGVLAESLYVSSQSQAALLKQGNVRQAIALAYAEALQAYLTATGSLGQ